MTEAVPDRSIAVADLLVALDFLEEVAEPACGDLFEAVRFLHMLFEEDGAKLRQAWPEWFSFYAARTGHAWRIGGVQ